MGENNFERRLLAMAQTLFARSHQIREGHRGSQEIPYYAAMQWAMLEVIQHQQDRVEALEEKTDALQG